MTSRLREGVLWAGAVAGLLSLITAVAVTFFGFSFLIFRSGSMGPEISTGSLALARTTQAAELRPGDVVSVVAANGDRITHRVVGSTVRTAEDGIATASLVLQGDANGTPDDEVYQVVDAERAIASLPYAGYIVTVLLSPAGLVAASCLAAMALLLGFERPVATSVGGGRHRADAPPRRQQRFVWTGAAVVVVVGVVGTPVVSTYATFQDTATLTSGEFTSAGVIVAPVTNVRCATGTLNDTIAWTAPVGATPTGYRLFYQGDPDSGSRDFLAGVTQGVPRVPSSTGTTTYTVRIAALYGTTVSASSEAVTIIGRRTSAVTAEWSC